MREEEEGRGGRTREPEDLTSIPHFVATGNTLEQNYLKLIKTMPVKIHKAPGLPTIPPFAAPRISGARNVTNCCNGNELGPQRA